MNIVEATQILHEQAESNGRTFSEEVIYISENLKTVSDTVYDAWQVWHEPASDYLSYGFDKKRIQELANDYKNLSLDPRAKKYFDSLIQK